MCSCDCTSEPVSGGKKSIMVKRLAFPINIHHFFYKVWFMICMCKLLNFPGERVALQCANGALTGSHSQFYDGSRTDWFVLCCCRVSEETLIHWHKHRGFTDSLRGADTFRFDTNEFIGKKKMTGLIHKRLFCLCRALQKPPCRAPGTGTAPSGQTAALGGLWAHWTGSGKWHF